MNPAFFHVFRSINHSDLTPGQRLYAHALLEIAPVGPVRLTWEQAGDALGGTRSKGSIRKILSIIRSAGLIDYKTDGCVWLTFFADGLPLQVNTFTATGKQDISEDTDGLPVAVNARDDFDNIDADDDPENEDIYRYRYTGLPLQVIPRDDLPTPIGLVGIDQDPISGDVGDKTNQPEPGEPVETAEQARTYNLLTDTEVGVGARAAKRLATSHRFEWVLRQTFAWLEDKAQGKVKDAGALVYRLDHAFAPGALTDGDRASPLYLRHISEAEDPDAYRQAREREQWKSLVNS